MGSLPPVVQNGFELEEHPIDQLSELKVPHNSQEIRGHALIVECRSL